MASSYNRPINERSLATVLNDLKEELKEFVAIRIQMLTNEMREKVSSLQTAIPALAIAAILGVTAWGLLTWSLVFLIAMAFGDQSWRMAAACGIVGVIYGLFAAIAAMYGIRTFRSQGFKPERTLRVLKQDKIWLKTEARTQQ